MKHILEYIQLSRDKIVNELYEDIEYIRQIEPPVNPELIKAEIENYSLKKRKAIDLMIDGLITKDDLKKQTEYYDEEISRLTEQLAESQNKNVLIKTQIDAIKVYVASVNKTASIDTNSTEVYSEMLKKVVVQENQKADFYLTCIPFGFRIKYHVKKFNQQHRFNVFIDSCEVIE